MRAPASAVVLGLCLLSQQGQAQVTQTAPGQRPRPERTSDSDYGPPRLVEIESLVLFEGYQGQHILTEGEVEEITPGRYWGLRAAGSELLLIPSHEFNASDFDRAVGRRVQVRGIARKIRPKEYVDGPGGRKVDRDLLDDPSLPVLPEPSEIRPRMSVTVFALKDRTYDSAPKNEPRSGGLARQILDDPGSYLGKKARVYGQFRGRNLFGDLPEGSARTPDDWVLKDGDTAMWVTGKEAKGKGWKLDPAYKGDTKNWLEVAGKPEVSNGVVYLKASDVVMAKAPASGTSASPSPKP
ncbi:MAG: hypothetical protein ABI672_08340 [Vicinamibacteria bacterium]